MGRVELPVEHIALLAALDFSEPEREAMARELGRVLEYMETLKTLPTEGIEAGFQVLPRPAGSPAPLREDRVTPSLPREAILANAPERSGEHFKVPPPLGAMEGPGTLPGAMEGPGTLPGEMEGPGDRPGKME